ncbi:MAG: sugar O-acetyltransferase [Alphaproteobacteria bacterium]
MLAGEPYRSRDDELIAMYHRSRDLGSAFDGTPSRDLEKKRQILDEWLGSIGDRTWVEAPFYCDYGENIHIGKDCFVNANCVLLDCNKITIGDNVLIGPAVQLYTATHPIAASERIVRDDPSLPEGSRYVTRALPIAIEDDVWIGGGAIVMPGIQIGARTTIGAGSVVTRSIPADTFAAGNPCRVVRRLSGP